MDGILSENMTKKPRKKTSQTLILIGGESPPKFIRGEKNDNGAKVHNCQIPLRVNVGRTLRDSPFQKEVDARKEEKSETGDQRKELRNMKVPIFQTDQKNQREKKRSVECR